TWTIFIGKTIELSVARRKLRLALKQSADARSLAEAQFALAAKDTVLSMLLSAALREARLSAGISSDSGIKERAASSFAEISRAEARRIRFGMGLLATIGATSPFVGLFGTVWGIMNSFIGISKSQTTNLAVVAPGIAEALLATAIGLVAAIPAVIIYNHFARQTKTYLELVSRASGAAARLLSRDLDRTGGVMHSRAAEQGGWALRSRQTGWATTRSSRKRTRSTSRPSSTSCWCSSSSSWWRRRSRPSIFRSTCQPHRRRRRRSRISRSMSASNRISRSPSARNPSSAPI